MANLPILGDALRLPRDGRRLLKDHPVFGRLSRSALKRLSDGATVKDLPKGTHLCRRGDPCEHLYVILAGRCEVIRPEDPSSSVRGPGEIIGRHELVTGRHYQADVFVASDALVLRIDTAGLSETLAQDARVLGTFAQSLYAAPRGVAPRRTRRVAALAFTEFSPESHRLISEIAGALATSSGREILAVELVPGTDSPSLDDWEACRPSANGSFCFADHLVDRGSWKSLTLTASGGPADSGSLPALLGHLNIHFPYVLVAVPTPVPGCLQALAQADVAFLYLHEREAELRAAAEILRSVPDVGANPDLHPVILHPETGPRPEIGRIAERIGVRPAAFVRGFGDGGSRARHIGHVARTIARARVGLALSSGSAKGLAHVGVIQVLEEAGVEIDVVAGTSMGAYVGACWNAGLDGERLQALAAEIDSGRAIRKLIDIVFPPRRGFLTGQRVLRRLSRSIGDGLQFSDLVRDLHVVATDLVTLERTTFNTGDVASAVHASFAIPGVVVPVEKDGHTYIDGAACSPLPVGVLEELGIERIIAVNALPSLDDLVRCGGEMPPEIPPGHLGARLGRFLNRHLNAFATGNLLDTLMRGLQASQIRMAAQAAARADVALHLYPFGSAWFRFDQHAAYIESGRQAALAALPELKALATTR
ncbi:hypothetical protein BH23VER1_BH23VER1_08740 [soil metagenome]